jgi:hypothetical protein
VLYLGYSFVPTAYAREREDEFWQWMRDRERWFYTGLAMVCGWTWTIEVAGENAGAIHHQVAFTGDTELTCYRRVLYQRAVDDPAWEARRTEQDRWYAITARTVQRTLPSMMGPPTPETTMQRRELRHPELRPVAAPVHEADGRSVARLRRMPLLSARRTRALTELPR